MLHRPYGPSSPQYVILSLDTTSSGPRTSGFWQSGRKPLVSFGWHSNGLIAERRSKKMSPCKSAVFILSGSAPRPSECT
eukprot:scaffold203978_cov43-Tisochrysis_lutea.AAC.1